MFDLDWVKEQLDENNNDYTIRMIFDSLITEIEKSKDNESASKEIIAYIQSVNHPIFAPLVNYSLWIFKRDYKAAISAAAAFHENAIKAAKEKTYLLSVVNFEIVIDIYKSLGKGYLDKFYDVIADILETIKTNEKSNDFRWNLELLELLAKNMDSLEVTTNRKIVSITEKGFQFFYDKKNMHLARCYLELQRKFINKIGNQKEIANVLEQIAMTYETDAGLRVNEPAVVCAFLKDALGYYELTGNTHKIEEIKLKLKTESKKVSYPKSSVEIKFPMEVVDNFIDYLTTLEIDKIPLEIASHAIFVPERKNVMQLTEDILKKYPLIAMTPTVSTFDGNDVKSSSSPEAIKDHQYRMQYSLQIKFNGLILDKIFKELAEKGMFNSEIVYQYLSNNMFFDQDDLETAKIGIEAYFNNNYVSCMHILIPKVENTIRNLMLLAGIPTTITDKDGIREGDLGSYLRKKEVEEIFGDDFGDYLKILLVEKDAINLRNRLAHGLLKYPEFNEVFASLMLFVYLKLGTLEQVPEEESG